MLIPKKFERQLENLDSDDDEEFPVPNTIHEPDGKQKVQYVTLFHLFLL